MSSESQYPAGSLLAGVEAQGTSAGDTIDKQIPAGVVALYPRSWVDHFIDWVRVLPIPGWLFYFGLWFVLSALETLAKWADHTYSVGTFFAYHALPQFSFVYALVVMQYLNEVATEALAVARPALVTDEREYQRLLYQLTVLPARPTLIAGALGITFGFFVFLTTQGLFSDLKIFTSAWATALELSIGLFLMWGTWGALVYHSVRQLRLVNTIYDNYARVDLFDLTPLYAFSGLTARTAAALAISIFPWLFLVPTAFAETAGGVVYVVCLIGVCIAVFWWPLWGVHRLLVEEKRCMQRDYNKQMQSSIADLHARLSRQDLAGIDTLKTAMDSLLVEERVLDKISTWPWQPGTVRGLAASLLLPVSVWLATRLLEKLGL